MSTPQFVLCEFLHAFIRQFLIVLPDISSLCPFSLSLTLPGSDFSSDQLYFVVQHDNLHDSVRLI